MTKADKEIVAQVIRESLQTNPDTLGITMAEEATKRLGKRIDAKDFSSVRVEIGLGVFQQIEREHLQDIQRAYQAGREDALRRTE